MIFRCRVDREREVSEARSVQEMLPAIIARAISCKRFMAASFKRAIIDCIFKIKDFLWYFQGGRTFYPVKFTEKIPGGGDPFFRVSFYLCKIEINLNRR